MTDIKWIKITTDIFDDDKILLIESLPDADAIIVIWFKLLCLAGKQNNNGVFLMNNRIAYTDKMLSTIFRRNELTVKLALDTFEQFGMIELIDGVITIPNWEKHQNIDGMDRIRERNRINTANYRARQKALADRNITRNLTVSERNNIDKDKEKEKEKEKDKEYKRRFTPPTLDEVRAYCQERNNSVDPERFIDFYQSKGWTVGKSPMKDWKAAVRNWEKDSKKTRRQQIDDDLRRWAEENE